MTRKKFEIGVLKSYQLLYLKYGEDQLCTPQLTPVIIELLLMEYPKIFKISQQKYAAVLPDILEIVPLLLNYRYSNIYILALQLTMLVFKSIYGKSRFFYIKMIYWVLISPRIRTFNVQYLQI